VKTIEPFRSGRVFSEIPRLRRTMVHRLIASASSSTITVVVAVATSTLSYPAASYNCIRGVIGYPGLP